MKKTLLLLLVFILTACSATGQGTELSRNREQWQDANITHYRFQLAVVCFCPVSGVMPLSVEVRDGEVISMQDVNGNDYPDGDPFGEFVLKYATMDRLFSELDTDSVREADKLTVSYDSTYGFPTEISIDFIELAMDDELGIYVTAFESLP
ncbi:MAG TPA: DUF6174 domain-containing protein [Anaerolineales bacterium]|nr:DUF6174 domain-containing protein [Anaerolineales bacterium]